MAGGDATSGASISASGTKNNRLNMTRDEYFLKKEQYIQEKLEALDVPEGKKEEVYATMRVEFGNEFDTQMKNISIENDFKLYNEKLSNQTGYIDVGNTVGKSNVTSDGYVIGGYAPEYEREIYLHNTFIQTGEGHIDTQFGTGSYPIGYYGLTDDKLVLEAKQDFWKNIGISVLTAPFGQSVGRSISLVSLVNNVGNGKINEAVFDALSFAFGQFGIDIATQVGKYYTGNRDGMIKIPNNALKRGESK